MAYADIEKRRAWIAANPERRRTYRHAYNTTHREQRREYAAAHPERHHAYRLAHPEAGSLRLARRRAKRYGVPCTLTLADVRALLAPMRCSVTGLSLKRGVDKCGPLSPTLDRIEPARGYVFDNVRLVCHRFNAMRKDADISRDAEFRERTLKEIHHDDEAMRAGRLARFPSMTVEATP